MIAFVSAHTMRFTFVFTYVTLFYVCPHVLPMPTGGHCQGLGLDSMSVMGRPQNLVYIYTSTWYMKVASSVTGV